MARWGQKCSLGSSVDRLPLVNGAGAQNPNWVFVVVVVVVVVLAALSLSCYMQDLFFVGAACRIFDWGMWDLVP